MTNKRIKMDCPFCGEPKENIQLIQYAKQIVIVKCPNPKCWVEIHGTSKQDVIDRWNCRV